jgi:hypothetical protein
MGQIQRDTFVIRHQLTIDSFRKMNPFAKKNKELYRLRSSEDFEVRTLNLAKRCSAANAVIVLASAVWPADFFKVNC